MKRLIAAALATGCLVSSSPVFAGDDDANVFDKWMNALVADGQACARFLAPDFIQAMLPQVGQRVTVGLGMPI